MASQINRRDFIKTGLASGAGIILPQLLSCSRKNGQKEDHDWVRLKTAYKDIDSLVDALHDGAIEKGQLTAAEAYAYIAKDSVRLGLSEDFNVTDTLDEVGKLRSKIARAVRTGTDREKLTALSYLFYRKLGYRVSLDQFYAGHDPLQDTDMPFINEVLEKKAGECVSLSTLLYAASRGTNAQLNIEQSYEHATLSLGQGDGRVYFESTERGRQYTVPEYRRREQAPGVYLTQNLLKPLSPSQAIALTLRNRVITQIKAGNTDQALADAERIGRLSHDSGDILWLKAEIMHVTENPEKALQEGLKAIEAEHGKTFRDEISAAGDRLSATIENFPEDKKSEELSRVFTASRGAFAKTRGINRLNEKQVRFISGLYVSIGYRKFMQKKIDSITSKARDDGERQLTLLEHLTIANLVKTTGYHKEALEWYERAEKTDSYKNTKEGAFLYSEKAGVLSLMGRHEEALESYGREEQILKSMEDEGRLSDYMGFLHFDRAHLLRKMRRYDHALKETASYFKSNPKSTPSIIKMTTLKASLLIAQGKPDDALEWLLDQNSVITKRIQDDRISAANEKNMGVEGLDASRDFRESGAMADDYTFYIGLSLYRRGRRGDIRRALRQFISARNLANMNGEPDQTLKYDLIIQGIMKSEGIKDLEGYVK